MSKAPEKSLMPLKKVDEELEAERAPVQNPLQNHVILKEVIGYLNVPGNVSYSTLQNGRLVCHLWNNLISRGFQFRSIIAATPNDNNLYNLIETFQTSSQESDRMKMTGLRISDAEWFESDRLFHWIRCYGPKLMGLELKIMQLTIKNFIDLLKECPNLEEVTLKDLALKHESHEITDLSVDNIIQFNFRHLTIKRGNASTFPLWEQYDNVEELAKHALLGMPPLESLNLQLTPGSCNLITFLATNPLRRDTVNILNNLKKLVLWNIYNDEAADVLNACGVHFRNLKELEIETSVLGSVQGLVEFISNTLEKLVWNCILSAETNTNHFEMPKLKEFVFRYLDIRGCEPPNLNLDRFIKPFPALKCWSTGGFNWDPRGLLSNSDCENAMCDHAQRLLTTSDTNFCKKNLEKFELFCSLTRANVVFDLVNHFPNLKNLFLWIHGATLNDYFVTLKKLEQLEVLTIHLSQSITDLPLAINSNLRYFLNLKELTLSKVADGFNSSIDWGSVFIWHLDKIHLGIVACEPLKILSFNNLKIEPREVQKLRLELLKKKPRLAFNTNEYI